MSPARDLTRSPTWSEGSAATSVTTAPSWPHWQIGCTTSLPGSCLVLLAKPLDAWVQAIAHHKVVDYLRRGHKIVEPVDEGSMQPDHNGDCGALHASEARHDVLQLLGGLPDKQRRAILHLKIEGLSVAETAALIGTSEVAVKLYVHRGLKSIAAKWRA